MVGLFRPRAASGERREQIVAATLRLLARTPIDALTTRQLAGEIGLTQPALFRHFPSREALLLAVVDHARGELDRLAAGVLASGAPPLVQLERLGTALLAHVEREPGLPRLLFASATTAAGPLREALRMVVAMQASLFTELVHEAQRDGSLSAVVDPEQAATLFLGLVQGLVLRWEIAGRAGGLAARFAPLFSLWQHGVAGRGDPRAPTTGAPTKPAPAAPAGAGPGLVRLDVRPLIAAGTDPLTVILAALAALPATGVLVLAAPFRPAPLLALLARRGHRASVHELARNHWQVEILGTGAPVIDELAELEPPEPLERVLAVPARLAAGDVYLARLPRFPRMLVPHLERAGAAFELLEGADGRTLLRLERVR
jgi:AcrR family transcriptional regulator